MKDLFFILVYLLIILIDVMIGTSSLLSGNLGLGAIMFFVAGTLFGITIMGITNNT